MMEEEGKVVVLEGGTEDKILLVYTVASYILLVIVRVTINYKFAHWLFFAYRTFPFLFSWSLQF